MSSVTIMTEEKSSRIQELLKEIWAAFLQAGTSNDREIVESLATLLTERMGTSLPEYARPRWPRNRYNPEDVLERLQNAVDIAGDAAQLFDRYILFYAVDKAKKEATYPLPRHLVDCMLRLLQVEPFHSFADFTCGTGGFLVNRNNVMKNQRSIPSGETVGVDRVQEVLRLAGANTILHGMAATYLYTGDTLSLCSPENYNTSLWPENARTNSADRERLTEKLFDRIAMAAPFGITVDAKLAKYWSDGSGHASENIFTRLALAKLAENGRTALLVPSSLTWKETEGIPTLRKLLLEQHTLQAVISLHEHALRPFSTNVASSIILLRKGPAPQQHQFWLCKVEQDGYTQSADRNLLMPPQQTPEKNDLPLIETALLLEPEAFTPILASATATTAQHTGLSIAPISLSEKFHGCVLQTDDHTQLKSLTLFTIESGGIPSQQPLYVLVEVKNTERDSVYCLILLSMQGMTSVIDVHTDQHSIFLTEVEAKVQLKVVHRLTRTPEGLRIYNNGFTKQKIVIAFDGRILGLTLPRQGVDEDDIQPEHYIQAREKAFSTRQPAETLEKIRQDQQLISRILTNLSGQLEVKPVVAANLPPLLHERVDSKIAEALGKQQQFLWQWIRIQYTHDQKKYALYFTAKDILHDLIPTGDSAKIQDTLDLLVCMGLLVRVLVTDKKTKRTLPYYRMPTQLDTTDLSRERELS